MSLALSSVLFTSFALAIGIEQIPKTIADVTNIESDDGAQFAHNEVDATKRFSSHSKLEWAKGKFSLCDQRVPSICADLRIGDAPGISLFDNGSGTAAITLLISPDVPFVADHSTADSVARVFSRGLRDAHRRLKQMRADADHNKVVGDEDEPERLDLVVVTGSSGSDSSGAGV